MLEGGGFLRRVDGNQGSARGVVDDLGVNVLDRPEDGQARALGAAADVAGDTGPALFLPGTFDLID